VVIVAVSFLSDTCTVLVGLLLQDAITITRVIISEYFIFIFLSVFYKLVSPPTEVNVWWRRQPLMQTLTFKLLRCQPELVEGGFFYLDQLRSRFLREHSNCIELLSFATCPYFSKGRT
jgi:hypothetical protein